MSPFGGWGSTLALLFVLVVAAIKAIWEDLKRHQEDRSTNASIAHRVMPDGGHPCAETCMTASARSLSFQGIILSIPHLPARVL